MKCQLKNFGKFINQYKYILVMKENCILTNGGNLLRHCVLGWYFQRPDGEFLREVSHEEANFLCKEGLGCEIEFLNPHPKEFPVWNKIGSYLVVNDFSNYRWETCNNGGNYWFKTYQDWFVSRINDKTVFRFVERHETSAEFSFDELSGQFQQNLEYIEIVNVKGTICSDNKYWYKTQWTNPEQLTYVPEVLEKISEMGTFEQLWKLGYEYIPSKWEDEEVDFTQLPALTFSDKKEIVRFLKLELEIDLREGYYRNSQRKGLIKKGRR